MRKIFLLLVPCSLFLVSSFAQPLNQKNKFTHQDSLRGTNGIERAWWDVLHYDITITPDYNSKTITGKTTIQYKVLSGQRSDYLQIDLQKPLLIDSIFYDNHLY